MTIQRFPGRHINDPAKVFGLDEVPLPAAYAIRDMNRAHDRFFNALALVTMGDEMPPSVFELAREDAGKHADLLVPENIGGMEVVKDTALIKFVHRVTGHPEAWVLSWQLLTYAQSLGGMRVDMAPARAKFEKLVAEAMNAISSGYNRSL